MARIARGNVVLDVEEADVNYYIDMGYDLVDEAGNVLKEAIPKNIGMLQAYYLEHTKKIAELEQTVADLTAKLEAAKKATKKAKDE